MQKISSGSQILDQFLAGGLDQDIITTIYGPSGSGKTNLCILSAVQVAKRNKKVIFIDTEGGICVERILQIGKDQSILNNFIFLRPVNFQEQKETFDKLKDFISDTIGMIVVDSISMLYRLELSKSQGVFETNSALGKMMGQLVEIARKKQIPVIITNQVYSDFDKRDQVKMVGGDLLKYSSKCLLELRKDEDIRSIILKKHRHLPEGNKIHFKIVETGIESINNFEE
jgi:DNA repair protein RadB